MAVPVMHGIGSRREGFSCLSAVRCGTGVLSIYHIGGDGQDGSGGDTAPVGMISLDVFHEIMYHRIGNLISPVIIISVFGEISLHLIIHHNAVFIPDGFYLRVLDGGQRIGHHRQAGDSRGEPAGHLPVMKSHLQPLIAVFVMHVMDDVQGIDVHLCQPFHHVMEFFHDFLIVQVFRGDGTVFGSHLFFGHLVHTAVDGVQQAFCQVRPGAEELHFLAHPHGGNTAGNGVVVSMGHPHQVIVLILDGGRSDGSFRAEPFEFLRKPGGPQDGQVGLRSSSQVLQGMKIAERHLCHQCSSVDSHTADGFRHPGGVAGKQGVILRGPGEFYHPKLHDKVIHKFLNLLFRKPAALQIPLRVNIQERGRSSQ